MEVDLSLVKMCILHVCVYLLQDPYGSSSYIPVLPYGVEIPNRVFVGGISYSVRTKVYYQCVGNENKGG